MNVPRIATRFSVLGLQLAVVLFSLTVLAILTVSPHYEGRNQGASWPEIYFNDPLLAYAYISSIAFFVAMYHLVNFLQYTKMASLSKQHLVYHLRRARFSLIALMGLVLGFSVYLAVVQRNIEEDIAGGISMSLLALTSVGLTVAVTIVLEHILQPRDNDKEEL